MHWLGYLSGELRAYVRSTIATRDGEDGKSRGHPSDSGDVSLKNLSNRQESTSCQQRMELVVTYLTLSCAKSRQTSAVASPLFTAGALKAATEWEPATVYLLAVGGELLETAKSRR